MLSDGTANMTDDDLLVEAGFKIFKGGVVVAADGGSSGNASICARRLIDLVKNERSSLRDHTAAEPTHDECEQVDVVEDLLAQLKIARTKLMEVRNSMYDSCKNLTTGVVHDPEDVEYLREEDRRIAEIDRAIVTGMNVVERKGTIRK